MSRFSGFLRRRRNVVLFSLVAVAVLVGVFATATRTSEPDLPTVEVKKGEFVDTLEIRGDIKPFKSIVLTSPMQSGELQIVKLAKNGAMVNPGDLLVQFDGSTLQRTIQEKQSELRQSDAEIEQARAQSRLTEEQNATALMKARYDIDRARLDVDRRRHGRAHRERQGEADAFRCPAAAPRAGREDQVGSHLRGSRRRGEVAQAREGALRSAAGRARPEEPRAAGAGAGMVNILPNYRSGNMFGGGEQEFREGDRAWPGAAIVELPDLSSVHLEARLDESDRGRLKASQEAIVRIEAIPGATSRRASTTSRCSPASTSAPAGRRPRTSISNLVLLDVDPEDPAGHDARWRASPPSACPTSCSCPPKSVFQRDGAPIVYRLDGSGVRRNAASDSARRGREQSIVASGVARRRSHRARAGRRPS